MKGFRQFLCHCSHAERRVATSCRCTYVCTQLKQAHSGNQREPCSLQAVHQVCLTSGFSTPVSSTQGRVFHIRCPQRYVKTASKCNKNKNVISTCFSPRSTVPSHAHLSLQSVCILLQATQSLLYPPCLESKRGPYTYIVV